MKNVAVGVEVAFEGRGLATTEGEEDREQVEAGGRRWRGCRV
jgi:hypothetical protein